jgi:hypothetical protein
MTKKRNCFLIVSIAAVLLISVLFLYFFTPNVCYWTFGQDPIETQMDEFLPRPDAIVYKVGGVRKWLNDEEIDIVYAKFMSIMETYKETDELALTYAKYFVGEMQFKYPWIEFRYKNRHQYRGDRILPGKSFEYDGILLILRRESSTVVVPCLGFTYVNIGFPTLRFHDDEWYYDANSLFVEFLKEL